MMADGVESVEEDMSFRDVETLEIRRREMVDDTMNDYQGYILTCSTTLFSLDFYTLKKVHEENNISQVIRNITESISVLSK